MGELERSNLQRISELALQGGSIFRAEVDIPALLREGALEALGGNLDFARNVLAIRNHGADSTLKVNEAGHYILSVFARGKGPKCAGREPKCADRGPKCADGYG